MADASQGVLGDELVGERIAGRFVVERLIGQGPLSTALRAHDERLHRRVTVKLFHPRHHDDVVVVKTQLEAAQAVARLSHEHIAMVIDRGEHDGMPLVVLEYVRGENLQERIERYAPLPVAEVVGYGLEIARALAHAHTEGVVHGNLRPENVLLTEDRSVKLVDFGGGSYVAQLVGDPYAAPELREVDPGTPPEPGDDIYALGALLVVALTEQAPSPGIEPGELQLARPDVSPRLATTIATALAYAPGDRHASMRELAAELAAASEALGTDARGVDRMPVGRGSGSWRNAPELAAAADETALLEAAAPATATTAVPRRRAPRRRRSANEVRARLLAWSMVLVPLALLLLVGVMIAGERASRQVDRGPATSGGPTRLVPVAGAVSFDPEPAGDGVEHPDDVPNAVDGDAASRWETEGYGRADFGGGKPGVGLVVQLEDEQDVREVSILTDLPGWTVEVRASDAPSRTLAGWHAVSEPTPIESGGKVHVDLHGTPTRHLLLWITRLAVDVDDPKWFRARIGEVRVFAADPR